MLSNLYSQDRVVLGEAELVRILSEHERFVARRGGTRAQLKCTDLSGQVLANRVLDEAEFTGASLVGANLFGSSLVRASLYCADLRNCNLRNTTLTKADLRGASFKGADLSNSVLDHADLRAAMMMCVGGGSVSFVDRSDTPGGVFGGVDFSNCSLRNTSFNNAKLDGANFSGSLLVGTNFQGAKLTNARFKGAVLIGVDVSHLGLPPAAFEDCIRDVAPDAETSAARLSAVVKEHQRWVETGGNAGAGGIVDGEDLRPLQSGFSNRSLIGLSARNAIAIGVDFSGSRLQGAKFDGSDLRGANFSNADLSGTSFRNAKLSHARFDGARLGSLHLRDNAILAPSFDGAEVYVEQFKASLVYDPSVLATIPSLAAA